MGVSLYVKQLYEIMGLQTNPALSIMQGFPFLGKEVSVIMERSEQPRRVLANGKTVANFIPLAIVLNADLLPELGTPAEEISEHNTFGYADYQKALTEQMPSDEVTEPAEVVSYVGACLVDEVADGLVHETFDFIVRKPKETIAALAEQMGKRKMVVLSESIHITGLDETQFTWLPLVKESVEKLPFFDLCVVVNVELLGDRYMEALRKELLIKSNIHEFQSAVLYLEEPEKQ